MQRIGALEKRYVAKALSNGFRTSLNSVFVNKFEAAFAKTFNAKFAISHVNGTATLHTALAALGVKAGDEVIVPPLTMSSTALAVLHNGSVPVFADVDPATYTILPEAIEKCVTPRTKAVITVSLYGLAPDYHAILRVCRKHGLFLIEDNAQCFLGEYHGRLVGEFGDFSSYSFQASKHLTSGEGGMLITNDQSLADNARRFSSLGYAGVSAKQGKITREDIQNPNYNRHVTLGFNYRMSEVTAAVALAQTERIKELVGIRTRVATEFMKALRGSKLAVPQTVPSGYRHSYWAFVFCLNIKDPRDWFRFRKIFKQNGGDDFYAAWKLTYDEPLFQKEVQGFPGIRQRYGRGLCPNAEYLQPRLVQLKTNYWDFHDAEKQARILRMTLRSFCEKKR